MYDENFKTCDALTSYKIIFFFNWVETTTQQNLNLNAAVRYAAWIFSEGNAIFFSTLTIQSFSIPSVFVQPEKINKQTSKKLWRLNILEFRSSHGVKWSEILTASTLLPTKLALAPGAPKGGVYSWALFLFNTVFTDSARNMEVHF